MLRIRKDRYWFCLSQPASAAGPGGSLDFGRERRNKQKKINKCYAKWWNEYVNSLGNRSVVGLILIYLKFNYIIILGRRSNFAVVESLLESNNSDIVALCEQFLCYWLCSFNKDGFCFLYMWYLFCVFASGFISFGIYFFFLHQSPPSLLRTVFDTVSSNADKIPNICFAVVFTPLRNSNHIVDSVSIDFPSNSKETLHTFELFLCGMG